MTRRRENGLRVWLREATLEDSERVWRWRNDAETRRGSFDERDIPFDEHREWFEATIQRRDRRMYVVLAGGAEAGVVRLDFEGSRAIVSINIAPEWRGKGIGKAALGALAERAFAGLGLGQLVARVKAALRRRSGAFAEEGAKRLRALDLVIDEDRFEVRRDGKAVVLTPTEFKLLAALAGSPGRVFTRDQLLERVWGDSHYDPHLVDVHVQNVRKKLGDDPADARYLETVRGIGYRFKVE